MTLYQLASLTVGIAGSGLLGYGIACDVRRHWPAVVDLWKYFQL